MKKRLWLGVLVVIIFRRNWRRKMYMDKRKKIAKIALEIQKDLTRIMLYGLYRLYTTNDETDRFTQRI